MVTLKDNFEKAKTVCILYTGGTGGNHLYNMLSLNNLFYIHDKKNIIEQYTEFDKTVYSGNYGICGIKAHFYPLKESELFNTEILEEMLLQQKKILVLGHCHTFYSYANTGILNNLCDLFWIIMKYPEAGSIPGRRIEMGKYISSGPDIYTVPFATFDPSLVDMSGITATKNNAILLDPEKFFDTTGYDYINEQFAPLGIQLAPEAEYMHKMWSAWMEYSMTLGDPNK
jgi:hypothetical protein